MRMWFDVPIHHEYRLFLDGILSILIYLEYRTNIECISSQQTRQSTLRSNEPLIIKLDLNQIGIEDDDLVLIPF